MLINGIKVARIGVRVVWLAALVGVIALAVLPHLLPPLGRDMYVVRGGSMQPAIPLGAVIIVRHVEPTEVAPGDVVTFRAPNGTIVTHRVVGVSSADELAFQTRGDASASTDPVLVPASALVGQVEIYIPQLGMVIGVLASTLGAVATLGLLGGLLLAVMFMDELLVIARRTSQRRAVLTEPAH